MTGNAYQLAAWRTNIDQPAQGAAVVGKDGMRIWMALGLAGEAGEVADIIKKGILHGKGTDTTGRIVEELGDVLWYVAGLASHYGLSLDDIMEANIAKIRERYPDGWPS